MTFECRLKEPCEPNKLADFSRPGWQSQRQGKLPWLRQRTTKWLRRGARAKSRAVARTKTSYEGFIAYLIEYDRAPRKPRQRVFKANQSSGRQGSGRQEIGYVDLRAKRFLHALKERGSKGAWVSQHLPGKKQTRRFKMPFIKDKLCIEVGRCYRDATS